MNARKTSSRYGGTLHRTREGALAHRAWVQHPKEWDPAWKVQNPVPAGDGDNAQIGEVWYDATDPDCPAVKVVECSVPGIIQIAA